MENFTSRSLHERSMVFAPSYRIWTPECSDVVRKPITVGLCVQEVKGIERDFTVQIFERTVLFILLTVRIMDN
jgi:hypothetical protein